MRHRCRVKKLSKPADQRRALLRSLTTELIRHGKITTTLIRAKVLRSEVEKMITLAKMAPWQHAAKPLAISSTNNWFTLMARMKLG